MTDKIADADWLDEAARYFENRDASGEDMAFWANVTNAERCRSIAQSLRSSQASQAGEVEFTHVAKTKLDGLLNDGWQINGYSIEKDGRIGLVTTGAFVGWYTNAVENAEAATALSAGVRVKEDSQRESGGVE